MHFKCVLLASLASLARIAVETDPRPVFFTLAATRLEFQTTENIKSFSVTAGNGVFDTVVDHVNISTLSRN